MLLPLRPPLAFNSSTRSQHVADWSNAISKTSPKQKINNELQGRAWELDWWALPVTHHILTCKHVTRCAKTLLLPITNKKTKKRKKLDRD